MTASHEIRRLRFGTIVRPAEETADGRARVEAIDGFAVAVRPGAWLLFDTGLAEGLPDADAHYRVERVRLPEALAAAGLDLADVVAAANCHLHFDHVGGNALLPVPVLVQRAELAAARGPDHTAPEVAAAPDERWRVIDGEHGIAPGLRLLPTPGHTAGHQSLLVDTADGPVLLAGQTHDTASAWTADVAALRRPADGVPPPPPWLAPLLARGLAEARFAHDAAVWRA